MTSSMNYNANVNAKVTGQDDVEELADALDKVEAKGDVAVDVDAEGADVAADEMGDVEDSVDQLDGAEAEVSVAAEGAADAASEMEDVADAVDDVDGSDAVVGVEAEGAAAAADELQDVADTAEDIDGTEAEVAVTGSGTEELIAAIEELTAALGAIPAETVVTVTADTSAAESAIAGVGASAEKVPAEKRIKIGEDGADATGGKLSVLADAADVMGSAGLTGASGVAAIGKAAAATAVPIAGVVAVAKQSVDAFVSLGRAAEKNSKLVGQTTEEYSRWVAVADDFGVSAQGITTGFVALERQMVKGSGAFASFGIDIKDAEGNLRSTNDVMLDVIGVINSIDDPTAQAAAGLALLGKGYKDIAPLVSNSESEMRGYLDTVSAGQVITAAEAQKAEDMAKAQDDLADSLMEVRLAIGQMVASLAPLIVLLAEIIGVIGKVIAPIQEWVQGVRDMDTAALDAVPGISQMNAMIEESGGPLRHGVKNLAEWASGADEAGAASEGSGSSHEDMARAMLEAGDSATATAQALADSGASSEEAAAAMEAAGFAADALATEEVAAAEAAAAAEKATEEYAAALEDEVAALEASAAANQERSDSMRAAADAQFALTDAQVDFNDEVAGLGEALAGTNGDLLKQQQVMQGVASSAADAADAEGRLAQEAAEAAGSTVGAVAAQDNWNRSMIASAASAGEAQGAVVDYIASVNGIPADKATEIKAMIAAGDLAGAEAALAEVSRKRDALVAVDSETAAAEAGIAELEGIAAGTPATIPVNSDTAVAQEDIEAAKKSAEEGFATIPVDANTGQADSKIDATANKDRLATIDSEAVTKPADSALNATAADKRLATIDSTAITAKAANDLLNVTSAARIARIMAQANRTDVVDNQLNQVARARIAPIMAQANTGAAESQLNNLARPRTASINTNVTRTETLIRVDGGGERVAIVGEYDASTWVEGDLSTYPQLPAGVVFYQIGMGWVVTGPGTVHGQPTVPGDILFALPRQRSYGDALYGDLVYGTRQPDDVNWTLPEVFFLVWVGNAPPPDQIPYPNSGCPFTPDHGHGGAWAPGWRIVVDVFYDDRVGSRDYGELNYGDEVYGDLAEPPYGGKRWVDVTQPSFHIETGDGMADGGPRVVVSELVVSFLDPIGRWFDMATPQTWHQPQPGDPIRVGLIDPLFRYHPIITGEIERIEDTHAADGGREVLVRGFGKIIDLVVDVWAQRPAELASDRFDWYAYAAGWDWDTAQTPFPPGDTMMLADKEPRVVTARDEMDRTVQSAGWFLDSDRRGRMRVRNWPHEPEGPTLRVADCWEAPDDPTADEKVIVAFGDSITAGTWLPSYADSWIPKLEARLGLPIENRSVGGAALHSPGGDPNVVLAQVTAALATGTPYTHALVAAGTNDLMTHDTNTITQSIDAARAIQEALDARGIKVIWVGVLPMGYGSSHNDADVPTLLARRVPLNDGLQLLAGANWYDTDHLFGADVDGFVVDTVVWLLDGLHPNTNGTTQMAYEFPIPESLDTDPMLVSHSIVFSNDESQLLNHVLTSNAAEDAVIVQVEDPFSVERFHRRGRAHGFPRSGMAWSDPYAAQLWAQRVVDRYAFITRQCEAFDVDTAVDQSWLTSLVDMETGRGVQVNRKSLTPMTLEGVIVGWRWRLDPGRWQGTLFVATTTSSM